MPPGSGLVPEKLGQGVRGVESNTYGVLHRGAQHLGCGALAHPTLPVGPVLATQADSSSPDSSGVPPPPPLGPGWEVTPGLSALVFRDPLSGSRPAFSPAPHLKAGPQVAGGHFC